MDVKTDDCELLDRYAKCRDEAAFRELVRRYLNMVYSAASRRVGGGHLAEDVTQAVFMILAQKAKAAHRVTPLSRWLLATVRYAAANALKIERRRSHHERAAAASRAAGACSPNPSDVLVWQEIATELDDAVLKLSAADRTAVLLRFFEQKPISAVAHALNTTEAAAGMRLTRAVEKLRQRLIRGGTVFVPAGATGLERLLSAKAVGVTSPGLWTSTTTLIGGAAGASATSLTIAKGAMTMMIWAKMNLAAAVIGVVLIGGAGGVIAVKSTTALAAAPARAAADENKPRPTEGAGGAGEAEKAEKKDGSSTVSLRSAPPVVVKTVPQAGAANIDPATTEIRVTYSKAMQDKSWSWSTWGEENFPKTTGKPHYATDARTCILPVKLEPGRTYAIWLNSNNFGNFKDSDGRQAVPYLLVFETKK